MLLLITSAFYRWKFRQNQSSRFEEESEQTGGKHLNKRLFFTSTVYLHVVKSCYLDVTLQLDTEVYTRTTYLFV